MSVKSCCVTGHREIANDKIVYVRERLREEIIKAIDDGFTNFISGFAIGIDLIFADIVAELKRQYPQITLEAAVPYRSRMNTKDKEFHRLIGCCNTVGILSEQYSKASLLNRSRQMVQLSERVIAVYDGRDGGGTLFTMRYAYTQEKQVVVIEV